MWREDLQQPMRERLLYGKIGNLKRSDGTEHYSAGAPARAMQLYNDTLTQTCASRNVKCLDLAALVPKDTTSFYDDVHFNEQGSQTVARAVADYAF